MLRLCSISEEGSRESLCLCWKVPYDVINLTLSNLGQSVCVPLAWSRVRGRASPIRDETGKLFSVFVMDVVFKTWTRSFSLLLTHISPILYPSPSFSLFYTQSVPLYLFCSKAAEAGEMKVTCGWARGCNTGHGSCLSLPLVSCVAASGTAALSTSETEPSRSWNITPSYSDFL